MKRAFSVFFQFKIGVIWASFCLIQSVAYCADTTQFAVAAQGYDLVGYFTDNKPVKGTGDHFVTLDGVEYLFVSDEHKKMFAAASEKYLPQYGGWCAFGTAVGKKIPSDPLAWKIVDGKLYFNLNAKVQNIWLKDIPGYIKKADVNWLKIKDKDPASL